MKKLKEFNKSRYATAIRALFISLAAYFVLFALASAGITPERYDIVVGAPASVTILATKDVEDAVTTKQMQDIAANAVELTYKSADNQVKTEVMREYNLLRDELLRVNAGEDVKPPIELTDKELEAFISADALTAKALLERVGSLMRDALDSTLPEGQEAATISRIERDVLADGYSNELASTVVKAARATLRANMLIDEETTEANRQKARDSVETEMRVKGEVIVREGEIVTLSQYAMLSSLGLIRNDGYDVPLIVGVALLVLLLVSAVGLYLSRYERWIWQNMRTLILLCLIFLIVIGLSLIVRELNVYMMPVSLGLLLMSVLIDQRVALFLNTVLAVFVSLLASTTSGTFTMSMFSIMLMAIVSGPAVALVMRKWHQRTALLVAGVVIGAMNFLTTLAVGLINNANFNTVVSYALWAAGGGILSSVLCLGIQPLMEILFNLVTSAKLLELSNPNQPLMRRLLLEAPGSYHHSIIVANLAETAADAVGADGLLARVGAYYHDVGKLKRPMYFKENQMGDNPHDRTDPRVSSAILTAHTRDGAAMAQKSRLPEAIIDIIAQHHGDSPMVYFYDKAKKLYGDADIADFRYDGPRPRSKEAAIVMLADTIEAAARSLPNPSPEKVDALIRKLVKEKMTDGQLDDSDLTFRDLDAICAAFSTVLSGVFHERIEYPDIPIPPRETEKPEPEPEPAPTPVVEEQPDAD